MVISDNPCQDEEQHTNSAHTGDCVCYKEAYHDLPHVCRICGTQWPPPHEVTQIRLKELEVRLSRLEQEFRQQQQIGA